MRRAFLAAALLLSSGAIALAQDHSGHTMDTAPAASDNPATAGYEAANAKMHGDMAITYTGDPDIDFLKSMIPHHQGAIDMARVVLEHGKDPEIRKLAEDIIAAQEKEIATMREWLKERGAE